MSNVTQLSKLEEDRALLIRASCQATDASKLFHSAFWSGTSQSYLTEAAYEKFEELAASLGYRVERIEPENPVPKEALELLK